MSDTLNYQLDLDESRFASGIAKAQESLRLLSDRAMHATRSFDAMEGVSDRALDEAIDDAKELTKALDGSADQARRAASQINRVGDEADRVGDKTRQMGGGFGAALASARALGVGAISALGPVLAALAPLAALAAAGGLLTKAVGSAAGLEQTQTAFESLTGSAEEALRLTEELTAAGASTPNSARGFYAAAQTLLAFKFEAREVPDILRSIANAAALSGSGDEGLESIATILGQIAAKGKVSNEELLQLAERKVPALDILSRALGKTSAEVQDMASKGLIPAREAIDALIAGFNEFGSAAQAQSLTTSGLVSTLQDQLDGLLVSLGQPINDALGPVLIRAQGLVLGLKDQAADLGERIGSGIEFGFAALESGQLGTLTIATLKLGAIEVGNLLARAALAGANTAAEQLQAGVAVAVELLQAGVGAAQVRIALESMLIAGFAEALAFFADTLDETIVDGAAKLARVAADPLGLNIGGLGDKADAGVRALMGTGNPLSARLREVAGGAAEEASQAMETGAEKVRKHLETAGRIALDYAQIYARELSSLPDLMDSSGARTEVVGALAAIQTKRAEIAAAGAAARADSGAAPGRVEDSAAAAALRQATAAAGAQTTASEQTIRAAEAQIRAGEASERAFRASTASSSPRSAPEGEPTAAPRGALAAAAASVRADFDQRLGLTRTRFQLALGEVDSAFRRALGADRRDASVIGAKSLAFEGKGSQADPLTLLLREVKSLRQDFIQLVGVA